MVLITRVLLRHQLMPEKSSGCSHWEKCPPSSPLLCLCLDFVFLKFILLLLAHIIRRLWRPCHVCYIWHWSIFLKTTVTLRLVPQYPVFIIPEFGLDWTQVSFCYVTFMFSWIAIVNILSLYCQVLDQLVTVLRLCDILFYSWLWNQLIHKTEAPSTSHYLSW